MKRAIRLKYKDSENFEELQGRLVATGNRPLIFVSKDRYWGNGMLPTVATKQGGPQLRGANTFGKLLQIQRLKMSLAGVKAWTEQEKEDWRGPSNVQEETCMWGDSLMVKRFEGDLIQETDLAHNKIPENTMGNSFEDDFMPDIDFDHTNVLAGDMFC